MFSCVTSIPRPKLYISYLRARLLQVCIVTVICSISRSGQFIPQTKMPSYKLTYFDVRGRGEPTRLIFKAAGVEFEDKRVTFEEWGALKACECDWFARVFVL